MGMQHQCRPAHSNTQGRSAGTKIRLCIRHNETWPDPASLSDRYTGRSDVQSDTPAVLRSASLDRTRLDIWSASRRRIITHLAHCALPVPATDAPLARLGAFPLGRTPLSGFLSADLCCSL